MNFEKYNDRRMRVLNSIPKRFFKNHYNPLDVLKKGASYSLIIALRNNGKSTAMLILILYAWQYFEYPSCWLRRRKESLTSRHIGTMFDKAFSIVPNKKKYDGYQLKNGAFCGYWIREKSKKEYDKPFCYTHSLSAQETQKGTKDIPNLLFIVFDEFMSRDVYLNNEFVVFVNALSTVFRECYDASIVMLGNPVSWACPYFDEMGIKKVRDIKQGTIKLYKANNSDTSIALEICGENQRNSKTDIINNRFFGFENNQIESIRTGAWELPFYPHLTKDNRNDIILDRSVYIRYDNELYCIEIRTHDNNLYCYVRPHTSDFDIDDIRVKRVYVQTQNNGIFHNKERNRLIAGDKIDKIIWGLYKSNKMFYSSNMTGETVRLALIDLLSSKTT